MKLVENIKSKICKCILREKLIIFRLFFTWYFNCSTKQDISRTRYKKKKKKTFHGTTRLVPWLFCLRKGPSPLPHSLYCTEENLIVYQVVCLLGIESTGMKWLMHLVSLNLVLFNTLRCKLGSEFSEDWLCVRFSCWVWF